LRQPWIGLVAVVLGIAASGFAQQQQQVSAPPADLPGRPTTAAAFGTSETRTFFPHHWIRGHLDFQVAPPHNEPDLSRCSQLPAANFGGADSQCTAYARWVVSGYIELQPIGRTFFRHVFVFFTPEFFFGRNVPRYSYTASFEPMADSRSIGVGLELPKNFELRLTSEHSDWLGRYTKDLGPADLGTEPPYGDNATVGLRWSFGGWGHSQASQ